MTRRFDHWIEAAARKHLPRIDWRIFRAQLIAESNLDPLAESPVGAVGIGQIMPGTWAEWAPRAGYPASDRTDPEASIFTAAAYMAYLYNEWTSPRPEIDRICLALASYNAGLGNVLKAQNAAKMQNGYKQIASGLPSVTGKHSKETQDYVRKILAGWMLEVAG